MSNLQHPQSAEPTYDYVVFPTPAFRLAEPSVLPNAQQAGTGNCNIVRVRETVRVGKPAIGRGYKQNSVNMHDQLVGVHASRLKPVQTDLKWVVGGGGSNLSCMFPLLQRLRSNPLLFGKCRNLCRPGQQHPTHGSPRKMRAHG